MSDGAAVVYEALTGFAFFQPRCSPSQELLAQRTGYSREWVNKKVAELERAGWIKKTKARRLGARWDHNVYTLLRGWHRPHRKAALAWLDGVRKRRLERPVHTKRTATAAIRLRGVASTRNVAGTTPTENRYVGESPEKFEGCRNVRPSVLESASACEGPERAAPFEHSSGTFSPTPKAGPTSLMYALARALLALPCLAVAVAQRLREDYRQLNSDLDYVACRSNAEIERLP